MSKYVFKNAEVEKALRLIAKELGVSDERFDKDLIHEMGCATAFISRNEYGLAALSFSKDLLNEIKEFDPNSWNDSDVIPPEDSELKGFSEVMLVEDEYGFPKKGVFSFTAYQWLECGPLTEMQCSRYRQYPSD